jgi:21S rRNA (GM2251-2'-O)-methyltransferase
LTFCESSKPNLSIHLDVLGFGDSDDGQKAANHTSLFICSVVREILPSIHHHSTAQTHSTQLNSTQLDLQIGRIETMTYTRVRCKSTTRFAATIMLALGVFQAKRAVVAAFTSSVPHQRSLVQAATTTTTTTTTVLYSTPLDDQGRRVRNRPEYEEQDNSNDGGWDGFDPLAGSSSSSDRRSSSPSSNSNSNSGSRAYSSSTKTEANSWGSGGGGSSSWDDFDPVGAPPSRSSDSNGPNRSPGRPRNDYDGGGRGGGGSRDRGGGERSGRGGGDRGADRGGRGDRGGDRRRNEVRSGYDNGGGDRRNNDFGGDRRNNDYGGSQKQPFGRNNNRNAEDKDDTRKINMKALEGAGFCHLYGLASVLNALEANRRDFTKLEDIIDLSLLEGEDLQHEMMQRERKPEAQFAPWLFVQEQKGPQRGRSTDKAVQAEKVLELAEERGIQVATVDKGVLNTLSGNRPHQGYVLRCGANLDFEPVTQIPHPDKDPDAPNLWLVLDEVVDPQNLGALLRSAFFLGGNGSVGKMGILVCAKNSAPPSPTVSAASAGALELMTVSSTSNLPRTLATAESDGFRIVGASASVPRDLDIPLYSLQDLPPSDRPTLVVLGSEGHGLRPLVTKSCTELVKIPGADSADGVDSLNVSVTGGILLWHFLSGPK